MKTRHLVTLLIMVAGCGPTATRTGQLTADAAGSLAQRLANGKAQALYNCQPFRKTSPAQFLEGHWRWHQSSGLGLGDVEAAVEFGPDGAKPTVTVTRLDSLPLLL